MAEVEIAEALSRFVHAFLNKFETLLKEYGEQTLAESTCHRKDRRIAKQIYDVLGYIEKDEIRKVSTEAAGEIFRVFEYQLMNITDTKDGSPLRALDISAADAVLRIMDYIYKNQDETFSQQLLTKGVLLGKLKLLSKADMSDHEVKLNGVRLQTTHLYKTSGRVTLIAGVCDKYFKRSIEKADESGFRLWFPWELPDASFVEVKRPPDEYRYQLNEEGLRRGLNRVLYQNKLNDLTQLSLRFNVIKPIGSFVGRSKELQAMHESLSACGKVVLCGPGGIGKTELARKYIQQYEHEYQDAIVWIDASDYQTMITCIKTFIVDVLEISLKNVEEGDKHIATVLDDVCNRLSSRKTLFVFDNARSDMERRRYEIQSVFANHKSISVLITSRNRSRYTVTAVLDLDPLSQEEAHEFIRKEMNIEEGSKETQIADLAKKLQCIPLTLQLAVAHIKEANRVYRYAGLLYHIEHFLEEFDQRTKSLELELRTYDCNAYIRTVYTMWKITIDKAPENCKQAKEILEMCVARYLKRFVKSVLVEFEKTSRLIRLIASKTLFPTDILAEGACEIFRIFEYQFINCTTDETDNHVRGLEKLAADSVDRILDYIHKNIDEVEYTRDFLTKAVIFGASKHRLRNMNLTNTGYSVKLNGKSIQSSQLFEMQGRVTLTDQGECDRYYKRPDCDDFKVCGFRLLFSWEKLDSHLQEYKNTSWNYRYVLFAQDFDAVIREILEKIDRNDKDKLHEKVHDIKKPVEETHEMVKQLYHGKMNSNKEIYFDVRPPNSSFTGRSKELVQLHENFQKQGDTGRARMVSVSGLGGVGKSELARKYIQEYAREYDNVVWINADKYDNLKDSFRRLYTRRNLQKGAEESIEDIVCAVYENLCDGSRKCLMVFDNAQMRQSRDKGDPGIEPFLPSSPAFARHCSVLITSRNREWGKVPVLALNVFTKDEAVEFIRKSLNLRQDTQEGQIENLAKKLQYFPLALQQAVAYINETDEEERSLGLEYTIDHYLNEFESKTTKLLSHTLPDSTDDLYLDTICTTWQITFDKIKNDEKCGKQAKEMLETIAYLAPDNIPLHLFLCQNDRSIVSCAAELLIRYCMLSPGRNETLFNIHRLVQTVTRLQLEERNGVIQVFDRTLQLFERTLQLFQERNIENVQAQDIKKISELSPHVKEFLLFFYRISDGSQLECFIKERGKCFWDTFSIFCQFSALLCEDKELWHFTRALLIDIQRAPEKFMRIIQIMIFQNLDTTSNTGTSDLCKFLIDAALRYIEGILSIDNSFLITNGYPLTTNILTSFIKLILSTLTSSYKDNSYIQTFAKEAERIFSEIENVMNRIDNGILKKHLELKEQQHGRDHIEIVPALNNLACGMYYSQDYEQAKMLFQRSLDIQTKFYGSDQHVGLCKTWNNLARVESQLGNHDQAEILLKRAPDVLEMYTRKLVQVHLSHFKALIDLTLKIIMENPNATLQFGQAGVLQKFIENMNATPQSGQAGEQSLPENVNATQQLTQALQNILEILDKVLLMFSHMKPRQNAH